MAKYGFQGKTSHMQFLQRVQFNHKGPKFTRHLKLQIKHVLAKSTTANQTVLMLPQFDRAGSLGLVYSLLLRLFK